MAVAQAVDQESAVWSLSPLFHVLKCLWARYWTTQNPWWLCWQCVSDVCCTQMHCMNEWKAKLYCKSHSVVIKTSLTIAYLIYFDAIHHCVGLVLKKGNMFVCFCHFYQSLPMLLIIISGLTVQRNAAGERNSYESQSSFFELFFDFKIQIIPMGYFFLSIFFYMNC